LLGSTATALINTSFIPVLSIPGETSISPIKIIMYASAFEEADILAIRRLIGLAEPFKAHLKLVHVSTSKEYAGEDQMAWFKEMLQSKVSYKDITYELHTSEEVTQTLMNCAEKADVSILAMLERENEGVFKKLWHSDTVKKMNKAIRRPLLSFNKKNI
jgi:nucleotide-binding universal stress UspA family protein